MCHGHIDLKYIERDVQDRLASVKPVSETAVDDDVTVPPGLIGGLPGLLALLRAAWPKLRRRMA